MRQLMSSHLAVPYRTSHMLGCLNHDGINVRLKDALDLLPLYIRRNQVRLRESLESPRTLTRLIGYNPVQTPRLSLPTNTGPRVDYLRTVA